MRILCRKVIRAKRISGQVRGVIVNPEDVSVGERAAVTVTVDTIPFDTEERLCSYGNCKDN